MQARPLDADDAPLHHLDALVLGAEDLRVGNDVDRRAVLRGAGLVLDADAVAERRPLDLTLLQPVPPGRGAGDHDRVDRDVARREPVQHEPADDIVAPVDPHHGVVAGADAHHDAAGPPVIVERIDGDA